MVDGAHHIIQSELSQELTLQGVTVSVQISRCDYDTRWALEVVSDGGMATLWNEQFRTEADALAAFHRVVVADGMGMFLAEGVRHTIH